MKHREVVRHLAAVDIRAHHEETRPAQLEILAAVLKALRIDIEVSSASSIRHLNPDPSDDELFFVVNEIVQRRFPVASTHE